MGTFSGFDSFPSTAWRTTSVIHPVWDAPRRNLLRIMDQLLLWQERAHQRHALRALDDHLLKDIGISRADAEREARKPFWRP